MKAAVSIVLLLVSLLALAASVVLMDGTMAADTREFGALLYVMAASGAMLSGIAAWRCAGRY